MDPAIPPLCIALCLSKVADCICLMALDKPQAVPVDVHMWQIAQRDYNWYPTTTQAKGPNPQANKELGKGREWDARAGSGLKWQKLLTPLPTTLPLWMGSRRNQLILLHHF